MAEQNDGRIEPKLDRVQRGQAITAEAWNKIVDRLNKPLDVTIRRTRRPKGGGGTPAELTVLTGVSVDSSGNLIFSTDTRKFLIEE